MRNSSAVARFWQMGDIELVSVLLRRGRTNPCIVDSDGKVAAEYTSEPKIRLLFEQNGKRTLQYYCHS